MSYRRGVNLEDLKAKLREIKEDVVTTKQHDFFTEMPYENFEWLIGYAEESLKIESELRDKVEKQQQEIERLNNEIKEIEKVSDYNADLRTKYEKALYEILDCGLDYAATTQEHHSCAEGMYRYAEQALGNKR